MDRENNVKNILDQLVPLMPRTWEEIIIVYALVGSSEKPIFCCNLAGILESDLDARTDTNIKNAIESIKTSLAWQRIRDQESGKLWYALRIRVKKDSPLVEVTEYPNQITDKDQVRRIANIE